MKSKIEQIKERVTLLERTGGPEKILVKITALALIKLGTRIEAMETRLKELEGVRTIPTALL